MGVLDFFRTFFFRDPGPEPPIDQAVGTMGTPMIGGFIQSPEKQAKLIGSQRFKTFSENIVNVSTIGMAVRYVLTLCKRADWQVVVDEELPAHKDAERGVELIRRSMLTMEVPWSRVVELLVMARYMGASVNEWIARKPEDGFVGMRTVESRPMHTIERWDLDEQGVLRGVEQWAPNLREPAYIRRGRLLYMVDDIFTDSPQGVGLIRQAQEDIRVMQRYEILEGIVTETDMKGIPVGRAPIALLNREVKNNRLKPEDRDAALKDLRTILENHIKTAKMGILLDSAPYTSSDAMANPSATPQWNVELMRGDAGAYEPLAAAIRAREQRIARLFNVAHMLVGANDRGSFAMVKSQANDLAETIMAVLDEVAMVATRDYGRAVLRNNNLDPMLPVRMVPDPVSQLDIVETTTSLLQMSQAGATMIPGDPAVNKVRRRLRLPPVPQEMIDQAMNLAIQAVTPDPAKGEKDVTPGKGDKKKTKDKVKKLAATGKGVMIALYPPPQVAKRLSLTGAAGSDSLHITLCYLGKGLELDQIERAIDVARSVAARTEPFAVGFNGVAQFRAGPDGIPIVLLMQSPEMTAFREAIARALAREGIVVAMNYEWTPHLTLAYGPSDHHERMMLLHKVEEAVEDFSGWTATSVVVAAGIEREECSFREVES